MSGCVRRRLEDAQSELESVETSLRTVGHVYVKQNARERELLATIAQLETQRTLNCWYDLWCSPCCW